MAINKIVKNSLGADAIDATKIADNAIETAQIKALNVTTAKLAADAVDATKIADDSISEEHLDVSSIIGHSELAESAAANDILLIYDTTSGTLKKILSSNVGVQGPTVSSVSPTAVASGDSTGNHTFVITGTGLALGNANLINSSGTTINFDTVTVNSPTQITGVIAKSSLPGSGEPYDVRVIAANGISASLLNQINIDQSPVFTTASGSIGNVVVGAAGSVTINATDPESAGDVTFELQSGSLPPSYSITNTAAEGGTAIIAGTDGTTSETTVFNFVVRAVDAASNTSSRAFSFTSRIPAYSGFTSSGTFAVPAGTTQADVLVVAGGGGSGSTIQTATVSAGAGAGGLIFMPAYPLTAGGTMTVTVGNGGSGGTNNAPNGANNNMTDGQDSAFGSPGDPGLGQGGVLTAKGGAKSGGYGAQTLAGGSASGANIYGTTSGTATQPVQPGNSGAYGFGNNGGLGSGVGAGPTGREPGLSGGGGGGAGAVGGPGPGCTGGTGGVGRAYTISDGTTSVYYAGGGGGGGQPAGPGGQGGGGGGGTGNNAGGPAQANKGGGAGGSRTPGTSSQQNGASGGKGIVLISY